MKLSINLNGQNYGVNLDFPFPASINLMFNQAQPNHFGAETAKTTPMRAGDFIGDTEQGGSCNVNEITLNPHCNGTHTETIRHICDNNAELALAIADINLPALMPCPLISVMPVNGKSSGENYSPTFDNDDMVITRAHLEQLLSGYQNNQLQAVAIRTIPNTDDKRIAFYNEVNQPPFFTREAILFLNERGVEHLIVDTPSIDRLHDDGQLTCHHLFWQVIEGMHQPTTNSLINKTITEMAYFDNLIVDGFYFVSLQTPAFDNDAAPSRLVLYSADPI